MFNNSTAIIHSADFFPRFRWASEIFSSEQEERGSKACAMNSSRWNLRGATLNLLWLIDALIKLFD